MGLRRTCCRPPRKLGFRSRSHTKSARSSIGEATQLTSRMVMNNGGADRPNGEFSEDEAPQGESDSKRYWRAAISHLSDPQKRDAAWEFYLHKLEARKAGDTLSALVLLLEANGAFLEQLPERYHERLIAPL